MKMCHTVIKNKLQWVTKPKLHNFQGNFWGFGLALNFLGKTSEPQSIKEQNDKSDFSIRNFCSLTDAIERKKKTRQGLGEIIYKPQVW